MGTSSLTCIYDDNGNVILIMHRQFDGYLEVHGNDLAVFLKSYIRDNEYKCNMKRLADDLFSHFKDNMNEYIEMVPINSTYYWCHCYAYHIYNDNVKIEGLKKDIVVKWKNDDFIEFCSQGEESEEEESEEESDNKDYNYDDFGKVDWDNFKSIESWVPPPNDYANFFKFNRIDYYRDSEDYIYVCDSNGDIDYTVGRFNSDTNMIDYD